MRRPAIRVDGLGKKYKITHEARGRYKTLRESVMDLAAAPFRRLKGESGTTQEEFWALKDVAFEVQPGEVVGIIGRNGAGKSTLLKVLSRITKPTTGRVELNGRVGSLLEVGTGFHPELTGRENVYLNGSILGMTRREIDRKFDEIVAFAEVEKFLDTPVKRYSSGMYVRLAFAVAAHLEPEILIIDEVLAVGDASFQKKCLGKMRESADSGCTVLLVSHQMANVRDLCGKAVWLSEGRVRANASTAMVIDEYTADSGVRNAPGEWSDLRHALRTGTGPVRFRAVSCYGATPSDPPVPDGSMNIIARLDSGVGASRDLRIEVRLADQFHTRVFQANSFEVWRPLELPQGETLVQFSIDQLHLAPGTYGVYLSVGDAEGYHDVISDALRIEVLPTRESEPQRWSELSLVTRSFDFAVRPVEVGSASIIQ